MIAALFGLEARQLGLLLLLDALLDLLAQIFRQFAVALLANGLRVPGSKLAVLQGRIASGTEEMVFMISFLEEFLATARDWLLTVSTVITEQLDVVRLAVWKAVILKEVRLGKRFIADVAAEMIWMPHLAQRRNGATLARLTAPCAFLEEQDLVMRCAIIIALKLVTVAAFEFDTTLFTAEMARVHELALDEQVGANDWPVAHGALMGVRTNDTLLGLHALGTIDVLCLGLDLVLLADEVGTAADTNEVL